MPSVQSTVIFTATLLGSLLQHAAAAPESSGSNLNINVDKRAELAQCISTCMRNSGCFDSGCVCKKADDGILSDIAICMNQWCPADVTVKDLISSLGGSCDLPKDAVRDAEKKNGVANDDDDEDSDDDADDDDDDDDDDEKPTGKPGKGNDATQTYDLGAPVTAPVPSSTTLKPPSSSVLTVSDEDVVTTGLLTVSGSPTGTPLPSNTYPSPTNPTETPKPSETDDPDNAAGLAGQASVFGVAAAMAVALVMGL
ncbi:hypothetical protein GGS20DRAFT_556494 [Poronia punctata]|nr:hypothetical protein GGS20DRAFT_556494 [Poronia punctata]